MSRRVKNRPTGASKHSQMRRLHAYQGGCCAICRRDLPCPDAARADRARGEVSLQDGAPTLDHVVPMIRGGSNKITNLLLTCYRCNHERDDAPLSEYSRHVWRANLIAIAVERGQRPAPAVCGFCALPHLCEIESRCAVFHADAAA